MAKSAQIMMLTLAVVSALWYVRSTMDDNTPAAQPLDDWVDPAPHLQSRSARETSGETAQPELPSLQDTPNLKEKSTSNAKAEAKQLREKLKGMERELATATQEKKSHLSKIAGLTDAKKTAEKKAAGHFDTLTQLEFELKKLKEKSASPKEKSGGGGGFVSPGAPSSDFHAPMAHFVAKDASPAEVSLLYRIKKLTSSFGLAATQTMLDALRPKEGAVRLIECARESGQCGLQASCADTNGEIEVIYGKSPTEKNSHLKVPSHTRSVRCSSQSFGGDPAHGTVKQCWIACAYTPGTPNKLDTCPQGEPKDLDWATIELCPPKSPRPNTANLLPWEAKLYEAGDLFCNSDKHRPGMKAYLDCRYKNAYNDAVIKSDKTVGAAPQMQWLDRAWVTYFKGDSTGMSHAMMVSNLIRSVHLFSKHPIIVYVVDTPEISVDWDPEVFPRLIIIHADPIESMTGGDKVSFNFNKFRSMMLRIKVGVQLDADMINGPQCDLLFDATEKEITAEYPYPILPVHWMTRYKGKGKIIDHYGMYAVTYPGDDAAAGSVTAKQFRPRMRWAHCHPTWTFHALPFIMDALLGKISFSEWQASPRVSKGIGVAVPDKNPKHFMNEDEDVLNILLWRYGAAKQWCKWDVEPGLYRQFLRRSSGNDRMPDSKWYPNGVPLVLLSMHNTKETVVTDQLLQSIHDNGAPKEYLFYKGKYYPDGKSLLKDHSHDLFPCTLVTEP